MWVAPRTEEPARLEAADADEAELVPGNAPIAQPAPAAEEAGELGGPVSDALLVGSMERAEAQRPQPQQQPPQAAVEDELDLVLRSTKWGVFRITAKKQLNRYVGFQARCPYHSLSQRSGCKKVVGFSPAASREEQKRSLRALLCCCRSQHTISWSGSVT